MRQTKAHVKSKNLRKIALTIAKSNRKFKSGKRNENNQKLVKECTTINAKKNKNISID